MEITYTYAPKLLTILDKCLVLILINVWEDHRAIPKTEILNQRQISTTPWGIKAATFHIVSQCLNQVRDPWINTNVPVIRPVD